MTCKNLGINISNCLSLCLSEQTLKAAGPFYLVSMPGVVQHPTRDTGGGNMPTDLLSWTPRTYSSLEKDIDPGHATLSNIPVFAQIWAAWRIHTF